MIKKVIVLLISAVFLLTGCTNTAIDESTTAVDKGAMKLIGKNHSPEELIEDIDFLIKTIEEVHPNPYAYVDKEKFYIELNNIKSKIDKPMNEVDLYKLIAPLISSLKDGHTSVHIPYHLFNEYLSFSGEKIFPLIIEIRDNKIFNIKVVGEDINIPIGAEIISINGMETDKIIKKLKNYETGMREPFKEIQLEGDFYFLSWLEYQMIDEYKITYKFNDKVATVDAKGVSKNIINTHLDEKFQQTNNYEYKILNDEICYLDFNSFSDTHSFEELLETMFIEIEEKNIENLIIDIRDNGGGNSSLGDLLISYIYDKPFYQYSKVDCKISKQIIERDNIGDSFKTGEVVTHKGDHYYKPDIDNRFNGKVCVLTNRYTFSSAADFAATVKDFNIGILLGEETGGLASSYGDVYSFSLPNSKLRCGVSFKYFVRPSGDEAANGVIPLHEVKQDFDDTSSDKDTVLEFAKEYILNEYDSEYKSLKSKVDIGLDYCEIKGEDKKQLANIVENLYKGLFENNYDSIYDEIFSEELKTMLTKDMIAEIASNVSSDFGKIQKVLISRIDGLKKNGKFSEYYVEGSITCEKGSLTFKVTLDETKKVMDIYTY